MNVILRRQLMYTAGVFNVVASEAILLVAPHLYAAWYLAWLGPLLALRAVTYMRKKWSSFMFDFCYFINALAVVHLLTPSSPAIFATCFMLSCGPLAGAILAWRNSLVFHDLEKMTSLFIHAGPPLLMYAQRWGNAASAVPPYLRCPEKSGGAGILGALSRAGTAAQCGGSFGASLVWPLLMHVAWQTLYTLKEEIWDRRTLAADHTIMTSLRWLSRSNGGVMHDIVLALMRGIGLMGPSEKFDASTIKTKAAFAAAQFVFTLITLIPTRFMFDSQRAHETVLVFYFVVATWNGSSYMFTVRSQRKVECSSSVAA